MKKIMILLFFAVSPMFATESEACTRVVYTGTDGMVVTGRTMDWRDVIPTNLYVFPRGMRREGYPKGETIRWTSRYGSVVSAGYDMGTSEGMNEEGLAVNMLYFSETDYGPDDGRPKMAVSVWAQYVLDNFASVAEAVAELRRGTFRIFAPAMPGGEKSTVHMAMSDASGNSAIVEYVGGRLDVFEGPQYRVMTNSPRYESQLAVGEYWHAVGGLNMLPGTVRSSDRFVRASFFDGTLPETSDPIRAAMGMLSVLRTVSVPLGITVEGHPDISSTLWRSICDHKTRRYWFEATDRPTLVWVDFAKLDFAEGAPVRKLTLADGKTRYGEMSSQFVDSEPFPFLYETSSAAASN